MLKVVSYETCLEILQLLELSEKLGEQLLNSCKICQHQIQVSSQPQALNIEVAKSCPNQGEEEM